MSQAEVAWEVQPEYIIGTPKPVKISTSTNSTSMDLTKTMEKKTKTFDVEKTNNNFDSKYPVPWLMPTTFEYMQRFPNSDVTVLVPKRKPTEPLNRFCNNAVECNLGRLLQNGNVVILDEESKDKELQPQLLSVSKSKRRRCEQM